jgi:hypothetical protein
LDHWFFSAATEACTAIEENRQEVGAFVSARACDVWGEWKVQPFASSIYIIYILIYIAIEHGPFIDDLLYYLLKLDEHSDFPRLHYRRVDTVPSKYATEGSWRFHDD